LQDNLISSTRWVFIWTLVSPLDTLFRITEKLTKVITIVKFSWKNSLIKMGKTPVNLTLTLWIWHHHAMVVISNMISKFNEKILRNCKVIANVKFLWQTNRPNAFFSLFYKAPITCKYLSRALRRFSRNSLLDFCNRVLGGSEGGLKSGSWKTNKKVNCCLNYLIFMHTPSTHMFWVVLIQFFVLSDFHLKMLGLYLYTLIIGHKSCNMLSILNKLTL